MKVTIKVTPKYIKIRDTKTGEKIDSILIYDKYNEYLLTDTIENVVKRLNIAYNK